MNCLVCHSLIFTPFSQQPEPNLAAILERLKSLEQSQTPTVETIKKDIVQYALRQSAEFDKHVALEKVEYLKHVARDTKDKKTGYYSSVHSTLVERINKSADQFKAYVLSLLGDRDYERIVEAVNKVDKTYNQTFPPYMQTSTSVSQNPSPTPSAILGNPHMPTVNSPYYFQPQFTHSAPQVYRQNQDFRRRRFCSYCNTPGHSFDRCIRRRSARPYPQSSRFGKNT